MHTAEPLLKTTGGVVTGTAVVVVVVVVVVGAGVVVDVVVVGVVVDVVVVVENAAAYAPNHRAMPPHEDLEGRHILAADEALQ